MAKMTDEQRKKIEKFMLSEFGSAEAAKATEEDKQGWFDYFTELDVELSRRSEARKKGQEV